MKLQFIKNNILLILISALSLSLSVYKLNSLMTFIGDQGWFYISARDLLLTHNIPLVGITSSHVWLHQGALWTYVLAVLLKLFNFNPLAGGYFTAVLGSITVFVVYVLSQELFSKKVGLIAAFLFATSPLVILDSRMPYHTSLIPIFTLFLIFSVFKWIRGKPIYFPIALGILTILYNLEIATFSLFATFSIIFIYGIFKKKNWIKGLLNRKIITLSLLFFLIPMIPMLLYDLNHGFPQTVRFVIWLFYKAAVIFGYPELHPGSISESWNTFGKFNVEALKNLIYIKNSFIAAFIFLTSVGLLFKLSYGDLKNKSKKISNILLLLFFAIPSLIFLAAKTGSAAYLPMLYPQVLIIIAVFFSQIMKKGTLIIIGLTLILLIGFSNVYVLLSNNYFHGISYSRRLEVAYEIIKTANGKEYNIIGRGENSKYESFVTPYTYLTWWLGKGVSESPEKLKFYITEYPDKIKLEVK